MQSACQHSSPKQGHGQHICCCMHQKADVVHWPQVVMLGSGDARYEQAMQTAESQHTNFR